jgi:hypothetical protein
MQHNCVKLKLAVAGHQMPLLAYVDRTVRFEDLMAARVKMAVFWVVVPSGLVELLNVSEVTAASIIEGIATHRPDDAGRSYF